MKNHRLTLGLTANSFCLLIPLVPVALRKGNSADSGATRRRRTRAVAEPSTQCSQLSLQFSFHFLLPRPDLQKGIRRYKLSNLKINPLMMWNFTYTQFSRKMNKVSLLLSFPLDWSFFLIRSEIFQGEFKLEKFEMKVGAGSGGRIALGDFLTIYLSRLLFCGGFLVVSLRNWTI